MKRDFPMQLLHMGCGEPLLRRCQPPAKRRQPLLLAKLNSDARKRVRESRS